MSFYCLVVNNSVNNANNLLFDYMDFFYYICCENNLKIEKKMNNLINDFKSDFRQQYSYVYIDDFINDEEIGKFIENNIELPYSQILNLFYDFVLSQGLCEVVE